MDKACKVEGCGKPHYQDDLCVMHLRRVQKYGTTDGGPTTHAGPVERFWRFVTPGKPDECWNWQGSKAHGYGQLKVKGNDPKVHRAHRLSYEIHCGAIPDGLIVLHACDNPSCVNPAHLSVGTWQDNVLDRDRKGRRSKIVPKGTEHPRALLDPDKVREIRTAQGKSIRKLAREYGVGATTIRSVLSRKTWAHID